MKQFMQAASLALVGTALLTGCSRPVATFQKSQPERFYSQQMVTTPVATADEMPGTDDVAVETTQPVAFAPEAVAATPVSVQAKQASDLVASLKTTHSADRRMTKRLERAEKMLTDVNQKVNVGAVTTAQPVETQKTSLAKRLMMKTMNAKIQRHLAPTNTKAVTGYVKLGAVIALVGLLLLLIGNGVGATIGLIALIVGLVFVLLGALNQGSLVVS